MVLVHLDFVLWSCFLVCYWIPPIFFQLYYYESDHSLHSIIFFGFIMWLTTGRCCLQIKQFLHGNALPWTFMYGHNPQTLSLLLQFLLMTILSAGACRSDWCSDPGRVLPCGNAAWWYCPLSWTINHGVLDSTWSTSMHSPGVEAYHLDPQLFVDFVCHGHFVMAP